MSKTKILLGTSNLSKLKQLQLFLQNLDIQLYLPDETIEVVEDQNTLIANARKKALSYSKLYKNNLVLATDGGVQIPYLGKKWNHVQTNRLSGSDKEEKLTSRKKCLFLLKLMKDASKIDRIIYWTEAYTIAYNNKIIFKHISKGEKGLLAKKMPKHFREDGYWLGYLWLIPTSKKHYMALTDEEKLGQKGSTYKFAKTLSKNLDKIMDRIPRS